MIFALCREIYSVWVQGKIYLFDFSYLSHDGRVPLGVNNFVTRQSKTIYLIVGLRRQSRRKTHSHTAAMPISNSGINEACIGMFVALIIAVIIVTLVRAR